MNREKKLAKLISNMMPPNRERLSEPYESDAELIRVGKRKMLFTIDAYSAEDMFREGEPETMGWNMAVGAISDILACGGKPLFYSHAITASPDWSEAYIEKLSRGVAAALKQSGAAFTGGDFGKSDSWKYTAAVIGEPTGKVISRRGAKPGDAIFLTGKVGAGNLEAALNLYAGKGHIRKMARVIKNRFHLRLREARVINRYARCCIDTSDGVFKALNHLCEENGTGYLIDNLPYLTKGTMLTKLLSLPRSLLFVGECGEYELLFTVRARREAEFLASSKKNGFVMHRIGSVTAEGRTLVENERRIDLGKVSFSARDFDDVREYLRALVKLVGGE